MNINDPQKEIADLKSQIRKLKKNNLGLVFEDKQEDVVEQSKTQVPVLKEVIKNRLELDKVYPNNLMIEGDNYLALSVLNYTHKGKIDLIYIDPPYNTGNHDFVYNDQYVDAEDGYRHSKWLSFMRNRLELARELLARNGVIFISIDDNEQAHLKILCDTIFGEENFIDNIVWDKKSSAKGVPPKNMMVNVHEYIIAYQKGDGFKFVGRERTEESGKFKNPDNDPRGPWRESNIKSTIKPIEEAFTIVDPNTGRKYTNTWAFSKESLDRMIKEERILWKDTLPKQKEFMREMRNENMAIKSSWGVFDAQSTTVLLKKLLPDVKFDNPKPIGLMEYLIRVVANRDATILDFFAGSGTTGHASLKLNAEDGGNRRFILCTNNEDNNGSGKKIATDICYPRIKKVIKGYSDTAGIPGNLFYYQTDLVDIEQIHKVPDEAKIRITYEAGEMIAVREDALNEVEKNDWWQIFEGKGKLVAIYFKEDKAKLAELIAKLEKKNLPTALYIFSWGKNEYKGEYSTANIRVEDIPEPIIEVYKELNRI